MDLLARIHELEKKNNPDHYNKKKCKKGNYRNLKKMLYKRI
jgi:hypothetical protein